MLHFQRGVLGLQTQQHVPCLNLPPEHVPPRHHATGPLGRAARVCWSSKLFSSRETPLCPSAGQRHAELSTTTTTTTLPAPDAQVCAATGVSSFKLSLSQLVDLVEKGFEEHGLLRYATRSLVAWYTLDVWQPMCMACYAGYVHAHLTCAHAIIHILASACSPIFMCMHVLGVLAQNAQSLSTSGAQGFIQHPSGTQERLMCCQKTAINAPSSQHASLCM